MAVIVLRSVKGSPLSIAEADANFSNLNTEVGTKFDAVEFTAENVLALLSEYDTDGNGQGLNAAMVLAKELDTTDTADTIALRDQEGGINATTFTGNLTGNVTGDVVGNLTGTVTGNASNVDGTVAISHGGTGATTDSGARTALGLGTMAVQNSSNISVTGGTITGITDLAVADGGTGASTVTQARTNLGLVIGSDVQPFSNELTAIAGATLSTGFYVRLGSGSVTERTITVGGNGLSITNGSGVSGNPVISIATDAVMQLSSLTTSLLQTPSITKTGTNGTGDIGQTGNRFGVIYGTATSARYADLAEKYTTDQEYAAGTVVVVSYEDSGAEATQSWLSGQRVLGVVSTNPAFLMNDEAPGQAIALRGRVPVKVVGPIRKGQPLISNQSGCGIYSDHQNSFAIALETNQDPGTKLVECVIL